MLIWLPLALATLFGASLVIGGWPAGLSLDLLHPYAYSSDSPAVSWLIQRLMDGSALHGERSGYPFGSHFVDYPMADAGSLGLLKLLGWLTGSHWAALNLYFLLGFPAALVTSYVVLRVMRTSRFMSASGSILFVFLPFHFSRLALGHWFLTWYFVVPIFFVLAWRLYAATSDDDVNSVFRNGRWLLYVPLLSLAGSFGLYYALFGIIVLIVGGLAGSVRRRSATTVLTTSGCVLLIALGIAINVAPNVLYAAKHGINPEAAHREIGESEVYGLKIVQMLLPPGRSPHQLDG